LFLILKADDCDDDSSGFDDGGDGGYCDNGDGVVM